MTYLDALVLVGTLCLPTLAVFAFIYFIERVMK